MKEATENLQQRTGVGSPVRVALIGAGPLSHPIAIQIAASLPGITLVAAADERLDAARRIVTEAGLRIPRVVESAFGLQAAIRWQEPAITRNWQLLCESPLIDAVIETADDPVLSRAIVRLATAAGKHVIPTTGEWDHDRSAARIEVVPLNADTDWQPAPASRPRTLAPDSEAPSPFPAARA